MSVTSDDAIQTTKDSDIIAVNEFNTQYFFNWEITGDGTGGSIRFMFRADTTYMDLPLGQHLYISHLSFITNDVTSYPNNLAVQFLYFRPKLQHEYNVGLSYHANQTELATPIQDYTTSPIYCGLTRKQLVGMTPTRIQCTFTPNTNAKTYICKLELICKKPNPQSD